MASSVKIKIIACCILMLVDVAIAAPLPGCDSPAPAEPSSPKAPAEPSSRKAPSSPAVSSPHAEPSSGCKPDSLAVGFTSGTDAIVNTFTQSDKTFSLGAVIASAEKATFSALSKSGNGCN